MGVYPRDVWSAFSATENPNTKFCLSTVARRSGDLQPPDLEKPEDCKSPFRDQNPKQSADSNFSQHLVSVAQNFGYRGIFFSP